MKRRHHCFILMLFAGLYGCQSKTAIVLQTPSTDFEKAVAFLDNKNDSAYYFFNKVVTHSKDSLLVARAYNQLAVLQSGVSDYFGAQENLLTSLKYLGGRNQKQRKCLASDYNELGLTSMDLRHFDAAIAFGDSAAKYSDYPQLQLVIRNNKALAYEKKGAYRAAINLYQTAMADMKIKDGADYARALSNLARTKWLQDPAYIPVPEFLRSLRIRKASEDLWGQNASYAHLAEYYTFKQPDSALFFAKERYRIALKLNNPDDRLGALQKLVMLAPGANTKGYFNLYHQLADSIQAARSAASNQFALIRYDAEKNKSDNLKLQKDNTKKNYQLDLQRIILYGILTAVIPGVAFFVFWYHKRQQTQQLEAANALQDTRLRLSKTVHDVVANGLYRLLSEVENQEHLDRNQLLDQIEDLYERSRDISYEHQEVAVPNHPEKIARLILAFASPQTKINLVGNEPDFWQPLSPEVCYQLGHILQELMVNMKKHSKAQNVVLKLEAMQNQRQITYTDDGCGISAGTPQKNGLQNTGNRINSIKGQLIFDPKEGNGVQLRLIFPIS